jgi:hypothetical protein
MGGDAELANLLLDSTIVRTHQHAGVQKGQDSQGLGHSRGGFSTKTHVAVNGEGKPAKLHLAEGERHDVTCAEVLLEGLAPKHVIADKE